MNKFEQVSNSDYQISVAGEDEGMGIPGPRSRWRGLGTPDPMSRVKVRVYPTM